MTLVFLYGTLRDPELLSIVLGDGGAPAALRDAWLDDHAVRAVEGAAFPLILPAEGQRVRGGAIEVAAGAMERLAFYEGPFFYAGQKRWITTDEGREQALVFFPADEKLRASDDWSLEGWQAAHGPVARQMAEEQMTYFGRMTPEEVAERRPVIGIRAGSALRAGAGETPVALRRPFSRAEVEVTRPRRPYSEYFALDDHCLRFRRFSGGASDEVRRAAFVGGDAATVLPYDPHRDRVLVIEQFRFGPYARGDLHPWALEPIAGRVDPGETPEQAARREAIEEAGVRLGALEKVAQYYPSPGAVTEYVYSYVGIADLPDTAAGLGGLEEEAEDILGHVIAFDRLMQLVATGEADTGPLLLSALWLAANRARLRASA